MVIGSPVVRILAIEDSAADQHLIREFLKCRKLVCEMTFVADGAEGLDYLFKRGRHAHAQTPHLILLDLNLPKRDGREVLAEIKGSPFLSSIPVIVLTSSSNPEDVRDVYRMHGNCYLVKPAELEDFEALMHQIESFWVETTLLTKAS